MNGYTVLAMTAAILVGANIFGSYAVGRSNFYDVRQKAVQIALIWLLPVFGLLLVGGVLWSNYERPSPIGDPPEHVIADFVGLGDGQEDFQHGGPWE